MIFASLFLLIVPLSLAVSRVPCAVFQAQLKSVVNEPQTTLMRWSEEPGLAPALAAGLRLQAAVLEEIAAESARSPGSSLDAVVVRAFSRAQGLWLGRDLADRLRISPVLGAPMIFTYAEMVHSLVDRRTMQRGWDVVQRALPGVFLLTDGEEDDLDLAQAAVRGLALIGHPGGSRIADGVRLSVDGFPVHDFVHATDDVDHFGLQESLIVPAGGGLSRSALLHYFEPRLRDESRLHAIVRDLRAYSALPGNNLSESDRLVVGRALLHAFRERPFWLRAQRTHFGPDFRAVDAERLALAWADDTSNQILLDLHQLSAYRGELEEAELLRLSRILYEQETSVTGIAALPDRVNARLVEFTRRFVASAWNSDLRIDGY